jgi:diguanylate cyclase (GGDEF)-like protein/PAS domain S-box-containing protein
MLVAAGALLGLSPVAVLLVAGSPAAGETPVPLAVAALAATLLGAAALAWVGRRVGRLARTVHALEREHETLRASAGRHSALLRHAANVVVVMDADGAVRHVSPAVETVLGYAPEGLVGSRAWPAVHPDDAGAAQAFHAELLAGAAAAASIEVRWRHREGTWRWLEVTGRDLRDQPEVRGLVLDARDITPRKALESEQQRVLHDELTGLPARTLFLDRVERALERSTGRGRFVGVLVCDLDRFKRVNDSFGHGRGDQVLVEITRRLRSCLRRIDTIARVGGDEFTVLVEEVTSNGDAVLVAERIVDALRAPFSVDGQEIYVGASIGIAIGDTGQGTTADTLLRNADIAMYRAKANGRACYEVFKPRMREPVRERLRTEAALRRALERGELRLHYQPKVDLRTGDLVGFEALVRWEHPDRGIVAPGAFVPMAEETGLILPIGQWVLATACRQAARWRDSERGRGLVMAVNLSPRQFRHARLVDDLDQVLHRAGLDAAGLELEITEGTAMGDAAATVRTLERLKSLGVRLAIDDFGTGYSSLSYLRRFPIDVLKVDRSFVSGLPGNGGDAAIVRTVVGLARALGLSVVAEGIETPGQLEVLCALGCDHGQGFLFGGPMPAEAADALVRRPAPGVSLVRPAAATAAAARSLG